VTLRLTYGIDPGQTGALAVLADGCFDRFIDMPTIPRPAGGNQINAVELATQVREVRANHPGAAEVAILEQVHAMKGQGVSGMFRFGEGYGVIQGVFGTLGIAIVLVHPSKWKRTFQLTGQDKDVARTVATQRLPAAASLLTRKKDIGRADAALLAIWGELTEAAGPGRS